MDYPSYDPKSANTPLTEEELAARRPEREHGICRCLERHQLHRCAATARCERWNREHADDPRRSWVEQCLGDAGGPVIAARIMYARWPISSAAGCRAIT
jgi:hypothetical protein